jgi:cytidylate kinase
MSAITISREFGCGGDSIARSVAQGLGYHLVDKEFISALLSQYGMVEFEREYQTLPGFWERFNAYRGQRRDQMVSLLNQVVEAVARHGNVVILGRSGFVVLGGYADVLHARLQAPFGARVERVVAQQKITYEEAEALVKESDRVRVAFVEEFYRVPWEAMLAFDLVLNTAKISHDLAAAFITQAAGALAAKAHRGRPRTSTIPVDPVLAQAVSDQLKCEIDHW